jgi:hypothetical protein
LRFAHNKQTTARFLRYQSKPRFARNQKRAEISIKAALRAQSRARFAHQSRAARVIKGVLRAAVNYTSKYFSRFALNEYFSRFPRLIKAALSLGNQRLGVTGG